MDQSFFVTGTDTEVGKTRVSAALLYGWRSRGLRVGAMKPVASGCEQTPAGLRNDDAERLIAQSSDSPDYGEVNPYAFEPAIAPHIAAAEAGVEMDLGHVVRLARRRAAGVERFLVEGVGGWEVPLTARESTADLAQRLGYPVVLVVGLRLGCINHALLTAEAVDRRGLRLAGWVANQIDPACARREAIVETLRNRIKAPCLGEVPWLEEPSPERVAACLQPPDLLD
ncbi:MAG: dethiobiotin synthase [Gammaproteobacteria bacterium]